MGRPGPVGSAFQIYDVWALTGQIVHSYAHLSSFNGKTGGSEVSIRMALQRPLAYCHTGLISN